MGQLYNIGKQFEMLRQLTPFSICLLVLVANANAKLLQNVEESFTVLQRGVHYIFCKSSAYWSIGKCCTG